MPRITIRDVGQYGMIIDTPYHESPPNSWNNLRNVRGKDKYLEPIFGEEARLNGTAPISNPWNVFYCPTVAGASWWVYGTSTQIGVANATDSKDITPTAMAPLAMNDENRYTGTWLNGVFFMNTYDEELMVWETIDPGTPTKMVPMSTVTTPAATEYQADWRFRAVRAFKEILIGIGFNDGTTDYPTTIKFSGPAAAGEVPVQWDEADLNNISGEQPLSVTPGFALDGIQIGNDFLICKEDATVLAQLTQGASALGFRYIDNTSGVLTQNCMIEFTKGQVAILNQNLDLMVCDGARVQTVLKRWVRDYLQARINTERFWQCYLTHNPVKGEIWVCYPIAGEETTSGELAAQEALVWNYRDMTFSFHDLGRITHISFGKVDDATSNDVIDDIDDIINQNSNLIDGGGLSGNWAMIGCSHVRDGFFRMDYGENIDDSPFTCTMERRGIALIGQALDGSPRVDHHKVKIIEAVWPIFEVAGTSITVNLSAGAQEYRDGPITWDGPYDFVPGTDQEIDFLVEGVYSAVKCEITSPEAWKFHAYGITIEPAGDQL